MLKYKKVKDISGEIAGDILMRLNEFKHGSVKSSIMNRLSLVCANFNKDLCDDLMKLINEFKHFVLPEIKKINNMLELLDYGEADLDIKLVRDI